MLVPNRLKSLYEGPMPPMGLTDYESLSKFLNAGAQRCKTSGRNFDLFLDWVIHALLARSFCQRPEPPPLCWTI